MLAILPFRKLLTMGNRLLVPLLAFFSMLVTPVIAWLAGNSNAILRILGRDNSFTGRIPLWNVVLQEIASRPLFGFGYGAFWTTERQTVFGRRSDGTHHTRITAS